MAFANLRRYLSRTYMLTSSFPARSLAYAEMRLIMAKLVWNFDIRLAEDSAGWDTRSRVYTLWEKPSLNVYLTARKVE